MKKFLRYLFILLGIVLVLVICGASFISIRGIPSYEKGNLNIKVVATAERIERGKKLSLLLCANCHKDPATGKLTGKEMHEAPTEFGKIFSQNITQDKQYGIGEWTDGELLYLFRTGIKRDGKYAPPWMAKLTNMADEDINSIIAFLHSDDPLVAASPTPDFPCQPSFLSKFLCTAVFKPFSMPDHIIEMPDTNNAIQLGKYLAHNLDCFSCHSADFKSNDYLEPEKSVGYFGGGNKPLDSEGKEIVTQNLTPDPETGIGRWSEERFVDALKNGKMVDQPALRLPMVPFVYLTDKEAKAIYAYLQTIPPIVNKVPRAPFD